MRCVLHSFRLHNRVIRSQKLPVPVATAVTTIDADRFSHNTISSEVQTMTPPRTSKVASSDGAAPGGDPAHLKHKRRFCKLEGCNRIVKSQGLCQRHGAKPRKCKVDGCDKQAQGNFDKMCKSHFKAMKRATTPLPKVAQGSLPPPPQGFSVYDSILPASIGYTSRKGSVMPLIAHLKEGFDGLKPPAWHRNEERRARGLYPIDNPATQLEGWERELVWMEILVLTGAPGASFRHLARAWGRDKGFHMVLAQFICERQGDVQRKRRLGENEGQMAFAAPAASGKSRGPAKKRRRIKKNSNHEADVSANIWDDSAYESLAANEALAADIFDFSPQEFESATALQRWKHMEDNSDTASLASQRSMASQAAATAILGSGDLSKIIPRPNSSRRSKGSSTTEHPEQNPETSALVIDSQSNQAPTIPANDAAGTMYAQGEQHQYAQTGMQQHQHYNVQVHQQQQVFHQNGQNQQMQPPHGFHQDVQDHPMQQQQYAQQYQGQSHQQQYGMDQQQHAPQMINHNAGIPMGPPADQEQFVPNHSQGQYITPQHDLQQQAHFQQQQQQQQHGHFVPQGQGALQQQHPEHNPETSAVPPELTHPQQGHHHQYQQH